jgi:hypothetical protein
MVKFDFKRVRSEWSARRERRALGVLAVYAPQAMAGSGWLAKRRVRGAIAVLRERNSHLVRNWYEGGFPLLTGDQSWLNQVVQDARFDKNFVTRRELMRRMRNHAQDVPIHKRGLDLSRQYVIGTHMPVVTSVATDSAPDKTGQNWCARAEEVWHEMISGAGLNGESFYQLLCVAHDCKKNDGDVGLIKTSRLWPVKTGNGSVIEVMRPCYQLVEAHRIETPFNKWDRDGKDIIDGVQFTEIEAPVPGRPGVKRTVLQRTGYWVKDTVNALAFKENFTLIPCEAMEFIYSSNRVNDVRGISDYYAVETTLHLLRDLIKLEMRAQEVQSDLTVFITNGAGQVVDLKMQGTLAAMGIKVSAGANGGNPIVTAEQIEKVKSVYNQIWGGRTFVGRTHDTLGFLAPNRPAEATLNLWQYLIDSYCVGARLPRVLVFPKTLAGKGQGTEVRAELDAANSGFVSEFNLNWKPLIKAAWIYFIGWAIQNDRRLADPPADWQNVEVSPPRSVLVDAGYDSAATISELQEGITNTHFIAQNLGTTEDRLISMSVRSLVKLKLACALAGEDPQLKKLEITIQPDEVRQSLGQNLIQPNEKENDDALETTL